MNKDFILEENLIITPEGKTHPFMVLIYIPYNSNTEKIL
ncbi:hypothetical protein Z046_02960 [Pseudomonas aeruginosa VRFPA09]|nr:hypothetical protein Z046_02960 [Pseudomonas aeruginosa VRFPA09]